MKKSLVFLLFLIAVIFVFSIFFGFYEVRFFSSRASFSTSSFSIDNSYVFITPLRARANGQEKIRLTVFILNNQGIGVLGKKIFISPNTALNVEVIQGLTDSFGKAYFNITSSAPGDYYLEIKADDITLADKAHLSFY